MAGIFQIPVNQNLPWFTFTMTLQQVAYQFEMAYSTRAERWYLSLRDAAGGPLVSNVPILIDRDLLNAYRTQAIPPGTFICIDTTGNQNQPTLGSFLTTHALCYIESGP